MHDIFASLVEFAKRTWAALLLAAVGIIEPIDVAKRFGFINPSYEPPINPDIVRVAFIVALLGSLFWWFHKERSAMASVNRSPDTRLEDALGYIATGRWRAISDEGALNAFKVREKTTVQASSLRPSSLRKSGRGKGAEPLPDFCAA